MLIDQSPFLCTKIPSFLSPYWSKPLPFQWLPLSKYLSLMTSRCPSFLLSRRVAVLSVSHLSPLLLHTRWLHTEPSATFNAAKINGNNADTSASFPRRSKRVNERRKRPMTAPAHAEDQVSAASSTSSIKVEVLDKEEGKKRPMIATFKDGKPWITVMGLGGAGSNAINNMIASQLEGVEFVVANTDCQALGRSLAPYKITLGKDITKGLGAGSKPELGKRSAEQQKVEIEQMLKGSNMLFITGGMGGGTCTGAAPVVASVARELNILTVGVVSTPFRSEGPNRTRLANAGVKELAKYVDTLIVVPNQNLLALADKSTTMLDAFRYADDVLLEGVKGVTDLIVRPGLINLDFADIKTILSNAGRAIMGSGVSSEEGRARKAAEQALVNPLLGDLPIESAHGLLVTIRGGEDMTLFEVDEIMEIIRNRVHDEANIIFGTCYDQSLDGFVYVSIIVSGIQTDVISPPIRGAHVPLQETHKRTDREELGAKAKPDEEEKPAEGLFSRFFSL